MNAISLAETPRRAEILAGQIKQAYADIAEAERAVAEAERRLENAKATLTGHEQRAKQYVTELEELAANAHSMIRAYGEPLNPRIVAA